MTSASLSVVFTRQFTTREWPQLHVPSLSVRLIRATDRCLNDYLNSLNVRPEAANAVRWQYRLWPRELTVGMAPESVSHLLSLPGFDARDLRAAANTGIDTWLHARPLAESSPALSTPAGALS
ncbi:MAG: hypothetical protein AAFX40_00100 [Cyanobacteria bacterium J06639_1]